MSIRIVAVSLFSIGLCVYAWKDWFKSLCGLILLMAVIEYPDMPHNVLGIQGLNLWNVVFGMTFLAWALNRRRQGLVWDMPRHVTILLLVYLGVILFGVLRAALDPGRLKDYTLSSLISEELINTVKWVFVGILLFDGCRTRHQVILAMVCLLTVYLLFAVEVIKWMPLAAFSDSGVMDRARLKLGKEIGYHCTDVSVMLAGACWGMLAMWPLLRRKWHILPILGAAAVIAFGQALTGGRGGYLAWGATGLTLCLVRWRKHLLLAPVVVVLLPIVFPGATARMLEGFGQRNAAGQATVDDNAASSGRTEMWPYVIAEIGKSPWIGYGRLAMKRTGLSQRVGLELGDDTWPHPHNMYLEILLDNGILGSLPILLFWSTAAVYSGVLFRSRNHLYSAVGGLSFALTLSSLFAGLTGQHFYPQEHTLGIWAAFFLSLRVHVEERQVAVTVDNMDAPWKEPPFLEMSAMRASGDLYGAQRSKGIEQVGG